MTDQPPPEAAPGSRDDPTRRRATPRAVVFAAVALAAVVVVGIAVGAWAAGTASGAAMPPARTTPVDGANRATSGSSSVVTPQTSASAVTPHVTTQPSTSSATPYARLSGVPMPKPTGSGATGPSQIPTAPRICASGEKVVGATWTATVPAGWSCVDAPGGGELVLRGGTSLIVVGRDTYRSSDQACGGASSGNKGATPLPATTWGGRTAASATFQSGTLTGQVRCLDVAGATYEMVGLPAGSTESLVAAMDALATSWAWT